MTDNLEDLEELKASIKSRREAYLRKNYPYEVVKVQDVPDFYFNGGTQIIDIGKNYNALCQLANGLNRLDFPWGIMYYVRKRA